MKWNLLIIFRKYILYYSLFLEISASKMQAIPFWVLLKKSLYFVNGDGGSSQLEYAGSWLSNWNKARKTFKIFRKDYNEHDALLRGYGNAVKADKTQNKVGTRHAKRQIMLASFWLTCFTFPQLDGDSFSTSWLHFRQTSKSGHNQEKTPHSTKNTSV